MKRTTLILILSLLAAVRLPALDDGDYLYSFSRTTDFPELERQYREMGIVYRTVTVENITGIVVTVKNGQFKDPTISFSLAIDPKGAITSPDTKTVSGTLSRNGTLSWSGYREHYQQKARMSVTGTLTPIREATRAGSGFDGVYLLEEELNGRKMAARIKGGYLTFEPLDKSDTDSPGTAARRIYGGQQIQEADLGRTSPKADSDTVPAERIPDWYLNPDNGPDHIAATGSKRMPDKAQALKAAETTAAANLALQIHARVKTSVTLWSRTTETAAGTEETEQLETAAEQTAYLPLGYKVIKAEYDEKTQTAWVMVAITKQEAETAVKQSFLQQIPAETTEKALQTAF
jgi:hypothetical protein